MANRIERRLDNGLMVLIEPLNRPAVATSLLLPTGAAADPLGAEGSANLLHAWCQRGAGGRDTRAVNEALENLGARRGGGAARESTSWTLSCLGADWSEAIALLADTVLDPTLPDDALEPCRALALAELAGLEDQPAQKLLVELTRRYFPTAFGRQLMGTVESVGAFSADALRAHQRAVCCPEGAVLSIAGGIDPDSALARVQALFGDWAGRATALPPAEPRTEPLYEHVEATTEQVHLGLMYGDVPPTDPLRYHGQMAVQVLSGGMGARLFTEVREKRGLCYSVGASALAVRSHGYVVVRAGTTTERSAETLEVMIGELRRLPGTVTADEVERSRVRLLSNEVMNDESTGSRAGRAALDWLWLGRVRSPEEVRAGIEAVGADSLNAYLADHRPERFTVATLGANFTWPAGLAL